MFASQVGRQKSKYKTITKTKHFGERLSISLYGNGLKKYIL